MAVFVFTRIHLSHSFSLTTQMSCKTPDPLSLSLSLSLYDSRTSCQISYQMPFLDKIVEVVPTPELWWRRLGFRRR
ncbi:hypothetical protein HanXRQr2_Chr11g0493221 [Helianthus annuus]|uniref:Uncharacterized protein n=1 Tax=Helianthus annuus TaxID=4232 RepID=A0A9K3N074_HELAN|nr:hypothetical protein HanXRQr2_Chr11g0493221 [Helianthus annuus]